MGWASGMQAGTNMAKQWIDTYNQANIRRGLRKLGPQASVVSGNTFEVDGAKGLVTDGAMGVDADGNPVDVVQAYANANKSIEDFNAGVGEDRRVALTGPAMQTGPGFAARAGSYDTGVHTDANIAQQGVDRYNTGLKRAQADVYRQFGNDTMGTSLDNSAAEGERYARTEARQTERDAEEQRRYDTKAGQDAATHAMGLGEANQRIDINKIVLAQHEQAQKDTNDVNAVAAQIKPGMPVAEIEALAKDLTPKARQMLVEGLVQQHEGRLKMLNAEIVEAIKPTGGNLDALLNLYKTDERFNPGEHFVKKVQPDGKVLLQRVVNGAPVGKAKEFNNEQVAAQFLIQSAVSPATALEWLLNNDAKQNAADLDEKVKGAQAVYYLANAAAENAKANSTTAGDKGAQAIRDRLTKPPKKKSSASSQSEIERRVMSLFPGL
jgi:hypothetical protein